MEQHLYYDTQARKLVNGPQDRSPATLPPFYQGDSVDLYLHGLTPTADPDSLGIYDDDPISFTGMKCGIGVGPDAAPPAGTFKLQLTGNDPATNQPYIETTAALPFDVAQADVLVALNNLASVQAVSPQGIKLDQVSPAPTNFFIIRWNDLTVKSTFQIVENRLEPLCFVRSVVEDLPAGQLQILKFIQAPLAFTDQFAYPASAPVVVSSIRVGTNAQNCIQRVSVPVTATGSFTLTFNTNVSTILPCATFNTATDASSQLAAALNGIYSDVQTRFSVTKPATGVYYVECVGPLAKTPVDLFAVTMLDQEPLDTPKATLPLNGISLELALHTQPKITLTFELEITDGTGITTAVQMPVTIINDMIDVGMSIGSDPNWLLPTDPTYPPYDPAGATIMAPGAYVTPIGSGIGEGTGGTSFVVTHNLGTTNCLVGVRETGGTHHRLPDNSYVTTYLDDNQIQVDFQAPPTDGQYFIIIAAVIPAAVALPHHTHPISDIVDLQDILTELENGIDPTAPIEDNQLPEHIGWNNPDGTPRFDTVPDSLIPDDVARVPLTGDELPPGTPYYVAGPPPSIVVTVPGPPPQTFPILVLDPTTNPPRWTLPVGVLPDPAQWPGLLQAILAALQSGATLPNTVVFEILDYTESFPPVFELTNHCPEDDTVATVPASIIPAAFNFPVGGDLTGGLPPPSTAGYVNKRFNVVGFATSSATVFRDAQTFLSGDVIASNGYHWYKVTASGNVIYPKEYERELFSLYVAPDMLAKGSRFAVDFTLQAQLLSPDLVRGEYLLTLEIGTPQANTGDGIGQNLSGINWYAQIVQEMIILSNANVYHHFNYAVQSDKTTGAYTASKGVYASTDLPAAVPASPGFAVRATLTEFDVENTVPNPSGQVNLKMLKAIASVVKPNS